MFESTKTYGHEQGLSCCFRQWRATHSHCSKLHGYALSFTFVFRAAVLDERNWVQDFGGLKTLKQWLVHNFDHTLAVAMDDPMAGELAELAERGLADIRWFDNVGCEAFAQAAFIEASEQFNDGRIQVVSCEVREHSGNSAIFRG